MPDLSIRQIPIKPLLILLVGAFVLCFTRTGQSHESDGVSYNRPVGWKTVCLGRFLIDLPSSAELGATKAKYEGAYGFDGINTGSSWGTLRYGEIKITETVPTGKAGFDKVRLGWQVRITSPEGFKELIQSRKEDLAYVVDRMAKSSPQNSALDAALLEDEKKALSDTIYSAKVTGEAKLDDRNGFAIRSGNRYMLGFLDPADQRVRTFQSERITSKIDSVQGAAEEYARMRERYHTRLPTDIPSGPGFCTYYGFIDEPLHAEPNVKMRVPIQIKQYPNLILALEIEPADPHGAPDIQKFPSMDTAHNALDKIGVKRTHGPTAVQILGTPGRSYAQEYGDNCSSTSCRPASQAYDMEARTFGDPNRLDRPRLMLHMTAALPDDYKLKLPSVPKGNNVPDRPALSGHMPPPYKIGQDIFEQVLRSIRPRPGGIVAQGGPAASSSVPQK